MPDNLTPEQRSYCMSRIKGKDTGLEIRVRSELHKRGFRFRKHLKGLPGRPDIVFTKAKIAIFIDGDFWHGYRFPMWKHKVSESWKMKISKTIERDADNSRRLHEMGWTVIRLWQHDLEQKYEDSIRDVLCTIQNEDGKARVNWQHYPDDARAREVAID